MSQEVAPPGDFLANRVNRPVVRRKADFLGEVVGAFESDTIAVFLRTAPRNEHVIIYIFSGMVLLFVALSFVINLDRVVISQAGIMMPSADYLYISPYDMGIVKEVNVIAGETVKKGQKLATLDPTFTLADLVQLKEHMSSDLAQIAREKAELARLRYDYDPKDHYQAMQGELWKQRQGEFKSTVENYQSQIKSTEAQLGQAESDVEKYTTRLKLWDDMNDMYKPLVEKGYAANLQLLQTTDSRTEVNRLLNDAKNQVPQYAGTVAALKAQLDSYIKTWDAATSTQLVADENDRDTTQDNLDKAQKMSDLTELDSPADAIVLQVGKVSKGSVLSGASGAGVTLSTPPLFTLTPIDAPLEAEADINTQDIGFIRVGDPVTLKVDAYPYIRFGTADGVVKTISEGSFSVDQNGQPTSPYFKVRVSVKQFKFRGVPANTRILVPGMTLEADVKVGKRSIWSYLTETALRTKDEAMREP